MSHRSTDDHTQSADPGRTRTHAVPRLIGLVLAAFVLVEALLLGIGMLVTRVLDDTGLHEQEVDVEEAILDARTPGWNDITTFGTLAGATIPVIVLTALACFLLYRLGRGPRLPVFLALAVVGETALFLLAALVINRDRPPIPQLDEAPPTSSFPSGHTAATIALGFGLALALYSLHRRHKLLPLIWVLAAAYALFVLASRLYRGMHWPTDVAASIVFVTVWLGLLRAILLPGGARDRRELPAHSSDRPPPLTR